MRIAENVPELSRSGNVEARPMTDDLRTRIAAAVFDTRVNQGDPIVTMVDCNGIADAVIADLGLALSTSGHYVAYGVELTDEERDQAGFTYHRRKEAADD